MHNEYGMLPSELPDGIRNEQAQRSGVYCAVDRVVQMKLAIFSYKVNVLMKLVLFNNKVNVPMKRNSIIRSMFQLY